MKKPANEWPQYRVVGFFIYNNNIESLTKAYCVRLCIVLWILSVELRNESHTDSSFKQRSTLIGLYITHTFTFSIYVQLLWVSIGYRFIMCEAIATWTTGLSDFFSAAGRMILCRFTRGAIKSLFSLTNQFKILSPFNTWIFSLISHLDRWY